MLEKVVEKAKREGKKVYIYTHKFPDGDAVGSATATMEYLKNNGIDASYIVSGEIFLYKNIFGEIQPKVPVEPGNISLILDTSTMEYTDSKEFKKSDKSDIFVIDHHEDDGKSIEAELELQPENVLRNSEASSVCEILTREMENQITPEIATKLFTGIVTDTARFKFIKQETIPAILILMKAGLDFNEMMQILERKGRLQDAVGLAKILLGVKKVDIAGRTGLTLQVDNETIKKAGEDFGLRAIQKKIFKMAGINDNVFNCIVAENAPGEYDLEFRTNPTFGDINAYEIAISFGGGGHPNASGCHMSCKDGYSFESMFPIIIEKASEVYKKSGKASEEVILNDKDEKLKAIFERTARLSKQVTPEILTEVQKLEVEPAKYQYLHTEYRSFEEFMLQNEMLARVNPICFKDRFPKVFINLTPKDVEELTKKYGVKEAQILGAIKGFSGITLSSAKITLPNGKASFMNGFGDITYRDSQPRKTRRIEEK